MQIELSLGLTQSILEQVLKPNLYAKPANPPCFSFLKQTNKPANAVIIVSSSGIVQKENSRTVGVGVCVGVVVVGFGLVVGLFVTGGRVALGFGVVVKVGCGVGLVVEVGWGVGVGSYGDPIVGKGIGTDFTRYCTEVLGP
jgi:hypothetical protein